MSSRHSQCPNSGKSRESEKLDGAKNGLRNIRRILKNIRFEKSMPRELTRASGVDKIMYSSRDAVFFSYESGQIPSSPGRDSVFARPRSRLCPAEIPSSPGQDSQCWMPGMLEKCNSHTLWALSDIMLDAWNAGKVQH